MNFNEITLLNKVIDIVTLEISASDGFISNTRKYEFQNEVLRKILDLSIYKQEEKRL